MVSAMRGKPASVGNKMNISAEGGMTQFWFIWVPVFEVYEYQDSDFEISLEYTPGIHPLGRSNVIFHLVKFSVTRIFFFFKSPFRRRPLKRQEKMFFRLQQREELFQYMFIYRSSQFAIAA